MPEYQSLYRKYRSQTFGDLVGQEAASRALQGAIISARVAHAYLFSGSRGTGKTSAARLLAKALNCTGRARDSAEPCNRCQSCTEMTAGSALDLIEIDAASNRGIDEIRDLREKVNLSPALGPCQQFVFRRHNEEQIAGRLTHIAKTEHVQVDDDAMQLIARSAQGSMRDAVGLLAQLVPLASGPITLESARALLGIADPRLLDSLLGDVLGGRAAEALDEVNRVYAAGAELRQVVRGLMESCRDRLVAALTRRDQATARRLSSVLDALLHLDGEVRRHAEPRFLVEATLARLAVEFGTAAAPAEPPVVVASPAKGVTAPVAVQSAVAAPDAISAVPGVVAMPAAPVVDSAVVGGWSDVLDKLNRTVRAAYLDAQPEVDGSTLVLWFRYGFHHKKAQEQSQQLLPLVRAWLGNGVKVDYRLRETGGTAAAPSPKGVVSPEDDPFVREVVRRFDGRVTRVKEVSE